MCLHSLIHPTWINRNIWRSHSCPLCGCAMIPVKCWRRLCKWGIPPKLSPFVKKAAVYQRGGAHSTSDSQGSTELRKIPWTAALLPCWVFVCVCLLWKLSDDWSEQLCCCWLSGDMKGGKRSGADDQQLGTLSLLSGTPQFPSSLSWCKRLQRESRLYLILPCCVLTDLVFCTRKSQRETPSLHFEDEEEDNSTCSD